MYIKTEEITNFVTIEMENGNKITVELYPEVAPITVENFKKLVSEDFYSGIIFHRVFYIRHIRKSSLAVAKELLTSLNNSLSSRLLPNQPST